MATNPHPVDSTTRACCKGIGAHTPQCAEQLHRLAARRARLLAELRRINRELERLDREETSLLLDGGR